MSNIEPLHDEKLRRLRVLQALATQPDNDWTGEKTVLRFCATDRELQADLEHVRLSLRWLARQRLIHVLDPDETPWIAAKLSPSGRGWLDAPGEHGLDIYSPDRVPPSGGDFRAGRVSSVVTLPLEIRAWLDQQLVTLGFRDYRGLATALKEQGWGISRSAVHRYGKKLKAQIAARTNRAKEKAEIARALAGVFGQDIPALMAGANGVALTAIMDAIESGAYNAEKDGLAALAKAVPGLGRGLFRADAERIKLTERRRALEAAANEVEQSEVVRGLDKDRVAELRRIITGIAA